MTKESIYMWLHALSDTFIKMVAANTLWSAVNFPIIFLAINLLYAEDISSFYILVPLILLLLPILYFPATVALYGVMRDLVLDRPDNRTVCNFFRYLRQNYFHSFLFGAADTGLLFLTAVLMVYFSEVNVILSVVLLVLFVYGLIVTLQFFAFQSHFEMPLLWKIKWMTRLVLAKPLYAIGEGVLLFLLVAVSVEITPLLILFLTAAAAAYSLFWLFEKQHKRIISSKK